MNLLFHFRLFHWLQYEAIAIVVARHSQACLPHCCMQQFCKVTWTFACLARTGCGLCVFVTQLPSAHRWSQSCTIGL